MVCRENAGHFAEFGHEWDIGFNATKSQTLTLGGYKPNPNLILDSRPLQWVNRVKYLGIKLYICKIAQTT